MSRLVTGVVAALFVVVVPTASGTRTDTHVALTRSASVAFPGHNGSIVFQYVRGMGFGVVSPDTGSYRPTTIPKRKLAPVGQPAYGPDGRTVAFVRYARQAHRLYTMNADGTNARRILPFGASPAWSPDGSQLSFIRALPSHPGVLWVVNADGSEAHQVWRGAGAVVRSHSWTTDGEAILFVASGRPGDVRARYVHAVRPDGQEPPRLFFEAPLGTSPGPLSPDGSTIVLRETSTGGIGTMSLADRSYQRVLDQSSDPASALLSEVVWSPDGSELGYTEVGRSPEPGSLFPRVDLFRLELASGQTTRVGAVGAGGVDWQPRCTQVGSAGRDRLRGTRGADLVCGLGGNDRVAGGAGNDRLFGEQGNDWIDSRDSGFDVVGCGRGRDTALADPGDLVGGDCESVRRSR